MVQFFFPPIVDLQFFTFLASGYRTGQAFKLKHLAGLVRTRSILAWPMSLRFGLNIFNSTIRKARMDTGDSARFPNRRFHF